LIREYSRREAQRLLELAKKEITDAEDPMSKISEVVSRMENIRSDAMDQTVFDTQSLFIDRMNYLEKKSE
jgi:hypothetical protein